MASTPLSLRAVALSLLGLAVAVEARHVRRRNACKPSATATPTSTSDVLATPTPTAVTTTTTTTTSSFCDPTSTHYPERCFVSIPTACTMVSIAIESPYGAQFASYCTEALKEMGTVMPEVASCFSDQYAATFNPPTAYACLTNNAVCTSTTAPCEPTATATPLIANGGFENGEFSPYVVRPGYTVPNPSTAVIAVTDEKSHSGRYSLKVDYKGPEQVGTEWAQTGIKLDPGANYELTWWWWSTNNVGQTGMIFRFDYVDTQTSAVRVNTWIPEGQPVGQWVQSTFTFTAQASFSMLTFALQCDTFRGSGPNALYIDDIELKKL